MIVQVVASCDALLLIRIAMCNQLALGRHDQREAALADANPIDHPPHFFEADLPRQASRWLADMREMDRDHCGRQQVVIDA